MYRPIMAPNRLEKGQRKQKKRSIDDDPFWDSWEDEETSPEPVARRRPKPSKKKYKQLAGSVDDPFGYDGFGDTWEEKKPGARQIIRRDSSPVVLPEDLVALEDAPDGSDSWCTSAVRKKSWSFEDHLKALTAKMAAIDAERDQKAALEAKKKASKEAAEAQAAAEKAVAKDEWNRQLALAKDCVARGDPVQALNMLYSLSQDVEIIHYIDEESKKEVSQLYTALYTHWELQQSLTQGLASRSSYDPPAGSEEEESSRIESTGSIGGDTVKVKKSIDEEESNEIETGSATVVADRHGLPSYVNKENAVSSSISSNESTVGGVAFNRLLRKHQSEENWCESLIEKSSGTSCPKLTENGITNQNIPHRSTRESDGNKRDNKDSI